jgi:hypothetical protein
VAFSAATATAGGRTRAVTGGGWPLTRLSLRQAQSATAGEAASSRAQGTGAMTLATPSALSAGGAFAVLFSEGSGSSGGAAAPALPTLPAGGPAGG